MRLIGLLAMMMALLSGCSTTPPKWEYLKLEYGSLNARSYSLSSSGQFHIIGHGTADEAIRESIQYLGGKPSDMPLETDIYDLLGSKGWELISCQETVPEIKLIKTEKYHGEVCIFKREKLSN